MAGADATDSLLEAATEVVPPETIAAFECLGNETRLAILLALWEAYDPGPGAEPVAFSDLYERVDLEDSGNFAYHLDKLTDHFVERTDEGYAITSSGLHLVGKVIEGTGIKDPTLEPTPVDDSCPLCGAPIEVAYENELLRARCSECGGLWQDGYESGTLFSFRLPPVGFEGRSPKEAFRATYTFSMQTVMAYHTGVCPFCSSPVETAVDVCTDHDAGDGGCGACGRNHLVELKRTCPTCKGGVWGPAKGSILRHPAVTAFYYERGIEHRFWEWESYGRMLSVEEELVSENPIQVRFTVPAPGDELRVTVDERLNVVAIEE